MSFGQFEQLKLLGHWVALRATIPMSVMGGHCGRTGFGLLMYHRVCNEVPGFQPPTWNVVPQIFEKQLRYLLRRGFEPWHLQDIIRCFQNDQIIPRQVFAVTFDDGYRCMMSEALPILRSLGIPATVFLATAFLDQKGKMPQDDWSGAGLAGVPEVSYEALTLEECDILAADPLITLGSHTHTHQDFRLRLDDFEADLVQSAEFLKSRWGLEDIPFAFPYGCSRGGYCTPEMSTIVKRQGFTCALTTDTRIIRPETDHRFSWGRIPVTNRDTGRTLAAKLDGWYGAFKNMGRRILPSPIF